MTSDQPQTFDISSYFERHPGDLSDDEFRHLVSELRAARGKFILGDKTAGSTKAPKAPKGPTLNLDIKL